MKLKDILSLESVYTLTRIYIYIYMYKIYTYIHVYIGVWKQGSRENITRVYKLTRSTKITSVVSPSTEAKRTNERNSRGKL